MAREPAQAVTSPATDVEPQPETIRVSGIVPPIPTPFRDGRLDLDSLCRLLDGLLESVDGVLVGGSLGESPSLTIGERETVIRTVANQLNGTRALVVSIADNSVEHSRRLSEAAAECDSSLLVLSCPNYFENDRAMLEAYFAAINEFASADLCLYDNPHASNTVLSAEDISALHRAAPRLTHVKMTDPAIGKVEQLLGLLDVTVFAGDDAVLWHHLLSGAEGMMASISMIYPQRTASMWQAFRRRDVASAYSDYKSLSHFIHCALSSQDYPAVIKAVLHRRGVLSSSELRLPLRRLSRERYGEVFAAFDAGL
jgi:4-hydroxy-tetrahydrodipicolinate synthase